METLNAHKILMLGGALMVATAGVASAGQLDDTIVAKVPFDFVVGTAQMPAGNYVVKNVSDDETVVLVESTDGRHAAYAITIPAPTNASDGRATLVFDKREDQYVLSKVMPSDGEGRELAPRHAVPHEEAAASTNP